MKPTFVLLLFCLCGGALFSEPRAWTSVDGRVLRAEFVSATSEDVTVKRADGVVLIVPLASLSAKDIAWVKSQPKPVEITQEQLDKLLARFPTLPGLNNGEVTNELAQLHDKYVSMARFMRPKTIEPNLKMIRKKLADDIAVFRQVAGTGTGDGTGKRHSGQSKAAENSILSARRALSWLEGPVTTYLESYDALLKKRERRS